MPAGMFHNLTFLARITILSIPFQWTKIICFLHVFMSMKSNPILISILTLPRINYTHWQTYESIYLRVRNIPIKRNGEQWRQRDVTWITHRMFRSLWSKIERR